ncbi:YitT family protein [Oceanispirochaeta crateris]|uniref:YitT family protein n=1 Tax=Oceanispirochaeta crateris TaxID=2518645 RepID=A0A5C1QNQ5_9SPIO|nr:YitT family protein [Oceanispirochaeta crateris]QEN07812.1 YitT family protein [Oceanispirochaeta crateris]
MSSRIKSIVGEIPSFLKISTGCLIMALGMNLFLIPNKIAAGGLSGIGIVIYHLFNFPVGVSVLILNIPLFLISWKLLGTSFGVKTLFSTILFSLLVDGTSFLRPMTDDLILSVIFGGVLVGLGLGIIFRNDATTGGTDLAAKIFHKLIPFMSIGQILLITDALVVVLAATVFGQYELALYASVSIFITARIIDVVVVGINYSKAAYIISLQSGRISSRILEELNRGVTELKGRGMFTGMDRPVLMCVLRSRDIPLMKKIVQDEDPQAFIFISDVREVFGEGFSFEQKR